MESPEAAILQRLTSIPSQTRPRFLAIGPDLAGNLLEIIRRALADDVNLVIHAMPLRPAFSDLLPWTRDDSHDQTETHRHSGRTLTDEEIASLATGGR